MLCLPGLDARVLAGDGALAIEPRDVLVIVLSKADHFGAPVLAWAAAELRKLCREGADRAASMLERENRHEADGDSLKALGEALIFGSSVGARLDARLDRFVPKRARKQAIGIANSAWLVKRPPQVPALVTETTLDGFVVEQPHRLTISWATHPFAVGAQVVLVDVCERRGPRVVRGSGRKAGEWAVFDGERRRVVNPTGGDGSSWDD
jgi:hypothetical protein